MSEDIYFIEADGAVKVGRSKNPVSNSRSEYFKRHYAENRINYWVNGTISSHKRRGFPVLISRIDLEDLALLSPDCYLCGRRVNWGFKGTPGPSPNSPTLDNLNLSDRLQNHNVAIACHSCNSRKNHRSFLEFLKYAAVFLVRARCNNPNRVYYERLLRRFRRLLTHGQSYSFVLAPKREADLPDGTVELELDRWEQVEFFKGLIADFANQVVAPLHEVAEPLAAVTVTLKVLGEKLDEVTRRLNDFTSSLEQSSSRQEIRSDDGRRYS